MAYKTFTFTNHLKHSIPFFPKSPLSSSSLNLINFATYSTPNFSRLNSTTISSNNFTWDDVIQIGHSYSDPSDLSGFFHKENLREFVPFVVEEQVVGYVHNEFASHLRSFQDVFLFPQDVVHNGNFGWHITLHPKLKSPEHRTSAVANVIKCLGEELIPGIRNEPHGIPCGENMMKECEEEAGIPMPISMKVEPVGAVSYMDINGDRLKRDVLFCYDLKLPQDFVPSNNDGEVESFRLIPVSHVANVIKRTQYFKSNCTLVIIDFLFRHGYICPEYAGYLKLLQSLRSGDCS